MVFTLIGVGSKSELTSAAVWPLSVVTVAVTLKGPCGPSANVSVQTPMNFAASAAGTVVCAAAGETAASKSVRANASASDPRRRRVGMEAPEKCKKRSTIFPQGDQKLQPKSAII